MNKLLPKTFLWMFVGLIVTFITGYVVSINDSMIDAVFNSPMFYILLIAELAIVIFFSARVRKMSPTTAKISFLLYAFVSGLTFSSAFILFELDSIMYVFLIAALVFAVFGALGYYTNLDLSNIVIYLLMGLIGIIICVIVNMFLGSETLDLVVSIIAILIFVGFTAYDVQHIKELSGSGVDDVVAAVNGAFELYLDFINIFLHLLQIIGDAKD